MAEAAPQDAWNTYFDELVQLLGRFLTAIAHDLKNPLSVIRGNAQLGLLTSSDEKAGVCFRRIIDAVDNITQIIDETTALRAPRDPPSVDVDLGEVMNAVLTSLEQQAEAAGVAFRYRQEEPAVIRGYQELLHKAFSHLVRNGIEAMPTGGVLSVGIDRRGQAYLVSVEDTGSGIRPEDVPLVFRRFFSTKPSGRGWGLIIADQVVRVAHGGTISFTTDRTGTRFDMVFPAPPPGEC
jgi:signal transduction histidine kinase